MSSRSVILIAYFSFLVGCTSASKNTVDAAYDADSPYCRDLAKPRYGMEGGSRGRALSHRDRYEQHCEPIAAWQARDSEGHERTIQVEQSLFGKLWDKIF